MGVKEEIISLTNEMKKQIVTNNLDYLETLEKLKEKVEILGNEQVQKKFNGVENLTEEEINELILHTNELSDIINDKIDIKVSENDLPNDLAKVREEMEQILGKSLFEGVENEYEFGISYQLDDYEVDRFQELRSELKDLLKDEVNNKEKIDNIRMEMFIILGLDPFTYKNNKKIIDELEEPNKTRFQNLKKQHEKLMNSKTKDTEKNTKENPIDTTPTEETSNKVSDEEKNKSAELIPTDNPTPTLVEPNEIKEVDPTKEPTGIIPVDNTPKTPLVPEPTPKKPRRLVKVVKSAKDFYKKHKKAILLVTGLVLGAILLTQLLPSIMYMNSILWHKFALEGAKQATLHNINLFIGSKIGASYAGASGIWTLSNGAILNATAANASLLASIGKVTLLTGGLGVTTTMAVKNAIKLAREKIEKFKNRKKDPKEEKTETKTPTKEKIKESFEKGKEKVQEKWEEHKQSKEEKQSNKFHRDDVSERINSQVNYMIDKCFINDEQQNELATCDKETFIKMFKDIYRGFITKDLNIMNQEPKNEQENVVEEQEQIANHYDQDIEEYINYCLKTGVWTEKDIATMRTISPTTSRQLFEGDPQFVEFRDNINNQEEKEKGK